VLAATWTACLRVVHAQQSYHRLCSDAKTDVKNDDGKVPLEVAQLNEQDAVVEILEKGKSTKETNGKASTTKESKQDVYL